MDIGIITRIIISKILKKTKESTISLDECFDIAIKNRNLAIVDKRFVYNVCITTIRNINTIEQILDIFTNKLNKKDISYFLILSSLCQIFYLNQKSYAVINSACEAHKEMNLNKSTKFINGLLRNIDRNKNIIKFNKLTKSKHPNWFKKNLKNLSSAKRKTIYKSINQKPSLHINFKNVNDIKLFKDKYIKTSSNSISTKQELIVSEINGYKEGRWWVQDYAATIPVKLMGDVYNKRILDMCAAPGGKTFQLIHKRARVTSYDVSQKRIDLMKENAKRLKYKIDIIKSDILKIPEKDKYDVVLLDAPCSSTGTIKKNPEILYRNTKPNLKFFTDIQYKMLIKASKLIRKNGFIIYSVCSFFEEEGSKQIEKFLSKYNNFIIKKITNSESKKFPRLVTNQGYFQSYPNDLINLGGIDGFFIARITKIK